MPVRRYRPVRVPEWRDPKGIAHSNYRYPCPNCGAAPRAGDEVVKIDRRWWHKACRQAHLSALRKEWDDP